MRDEPIAGLAINDRHLRVVLLGREEAPGAKKTGVVIKVIVDEPIPSGVIERGEIKNDRELALALQRLLDKTPTKITYAILTLPQELAYSRIFHFPKNITGDKLDQTMKMTIGFNMPVSTQEVYLDWERFDTGTNEIFLETIKKSAADAYIKILESVGIRVVAIESQPSSMARVIQLKNDLPVMVVTRGLYGTCFVIIRDRLVRFTRYTPKRLEDKELQMEIKRLSDFYEAEDTPITEVIEFEKADIVPKFAEHPVIKGQGYKWLGAVGAALRGLLPRGNDKLVSLMPIGTEKSYEYQKSIIFTKFISDVVMGTAIFFIIAFLGALILISSIGNTLGTQISDLTTSSASQGASEYEMRAQRFNNLTAAISEIYSASPRWSKFLTELKIKTPVGITITAVSITSPNSPFTLTGIGKTRDLINAFRKTLEDSTTFTDVKLPITNLQQRTDIPFSMTLRIENQRFLFTK